MSIAIICMFLLNKMLYKLPVFCSWECCLSKGVTCKVGPWENQVNKQPLTNSKGWATKTHAGITATDSHQ